MKKTIQVIDIIKTNSRPIAIDINPNSNLIYVVGDEISVIDGRILPGD